MPPAPSGPPPRMTWGKASPVLAIAALFDLLRAMCNQLWFFGPVLGAAIAGAATNAAVRGYLGSTIGSGAGAAVSAGVSVLSTLGVAPLQAFGLVLGIAVGFLGWMSVGFSLLMLNPRYFKGATGRLLWFFGSLLVSEVPFVGTLPGLTISMWRAHHTQIKEEKAAYAAWEKEEATRMQSARKEQIMRAYIVQMRAQAANDNLQASNDNNEIPEQERAAA